MTEMACLGNPFFSRFFLKQQRLYRFLSKKIITTIVYLIASECITVSKDNLYSPTIKHIPE